MVARPTENVDIRQPSAQPQRAEEKKRQRGAFGPQQQQERQETGITVSSRPEFFAA
jgi:hypothetical protein